MDVPLRNDSLPKNEPLNLTLSCPGFAASVHFHLTVFRVADVPHVETNFVKTLKAQPLHEFYSPSLLDIHLVLQPVSVKREEAKS